MMLKNNFFSELIKQFSFFGSTLFFILTTTYFFLNNHEIFIDLLISLFLIIIIGYSLRILFFRERPKKKIYHTLIEKINASSFPSGHSARATALFFILSKNQTKLIMLFFFIILLFVFYSRIKLKEHYLFDIIGGIILGLISLIIFL